jgi:hypothetical protein
MPIVFRAILVALGLFGVGLSFWLGYMASRARSWQAVAGEIIASSLESDPHDADSSVNITYRYDVDGHAYTSHQITYSAMPNGAEAKAALVASYPAGRQVQVYYDPDKPSRAVLRNESSPMWLALTAVGVVFVAIGLFAP